MNKCFVCRTELFEKDGLKASSMHHDSDSSSFFNTKNICDNHLSEILPDESNRNMCQEDIAELNKQDLIYHMTKISNILVIYITEKTFVYGTDENIKNLGIGMSKYES